MNEGIRFKKLLILCLSLVFLVIKVSVDAQEKKEFPFPVIQYKFENGLHVILSEDHSLPLVSVVVAYNVGSINEDPGKTGLAHLVENLMFQGSENVRQMQHISTINRVGGEFNAATTEDKTFFLQRVSSNQLAQVLWLESDRMKSLEINASNVEQAKLDILEEIDRLKTENPYKESFWYFDRLLYSDFVFGHPVIGNPDDLRNLTFRDAKNFYNTYYVHNNAQSWEISTGRKPWKISENILNPFRREERFPPVPCRRFQKKNQPSILLLALLRHLLAFIWVSD